MYALNEPLVLIDDVAREVKMVIGMPHAVARDLGIAEHVVSDWAGRASVPVSVARDAVGRYRERQATARAEKTRRDHAQAAAQAAEDAARVQAAIHAGMEAAQTAAKWGERHWHLVAAGAIHRSYYGPPKEAA